MTRKAALLIFLLSATTYARAEYFFVINDVTTSQCLYSDLKGKNQYKKTLEKSYGVECSADDDVAGTVIVTCKKNLTNIIYATKTQDKCLSLRRSMNDLIGRKN